MRHSRLATEGPGWLSVDPGHGPATGSRRPKLRGARFRGLAFRPHRGLLAPLRRKPGTGIAMVGRRGAWGGRGGSDRRECHWQLTPTPTPGATGNSESKDNRSEGGGARGVAGGDSPSHPAHFFIEDWPL